MSETSLLEFPCEFPIKAMGKSDNAFEIIVVDIVRRHAPELYEHAVKSRPSKDGNYVSITVTIRATSQEQLDSIYRDLTAHPLVLMAL